MEKRIIALVVLAFLLIGNVSAFTSVRLYNARAVVEGQVGETVSRTIRMSNPNDVDVLVEISASGELADKIKIDEESFTLSPGEEKTVAYTIRATDPGTTESRLGITTLPEGETNGIALTSVIIFNARGESIEDEPAVIDENSETEGITEDNAEGNNGFSFNPTNKAEVPKSFSFSDISPIVYLLGSSILLMLILIVLVILSGKKKSPPLMKKDESQVIKEIKEDVSLMNEPSSEVKENKTKKRKAVRGRS